MTRNILWGVDGTLFNTYPAITYAMSRALNELGLVVALNVIDGLARISLDHCVTILAQRFRLDPEALHRRFAECYATVPLARQQPLPGAPQLCALIHERGGHNIIITHRSLCSTQALLDAHSLTAFFGGIVSVEQGYPPKPDPTMVLAALRLYALQPAKTLLVGDHELDIQAGRAGGVATCLVGRAPLAQPADLQIDEYGQLLAWLRYDRSMN